jgi:hypothetical protein
MRPPRETPCGYCFRVWATGEDHLIPQAAGGLTVAENLYPACPRCNAILGDRIFDSIDAKRAYVRAELFRRGEWEGRCPVCQGPMKAKNRRRQFCSAKCRAAAWQRKRGDDLAVVEEQLTRALARIRALRRPAKDCA